jgi:glucan phosphoethanolaminetransferase (alkaline phosphatase superfamily)
MVAAVVSDAARRGERLVEFEWLYRGTYLAAALESLAVWGTLLYVASQRSGVARWVAALLFVVFATFAFGGQQYFYEQYNAYLNVDVSLFASNFTDSIVSQLFADIGNYLMAKLPPLLAAILLVVVGRRILPRAAEPPRYAALAAPILLVAAFFIPTQHRHVQASTPDVLYLNAIGGVIRTQLGITDQSHQERPRARDSLRVPKLVSAPDAAQPNVLFVILESVRADSACSAYEPGCKKTLATNLLLPNRFPLLQMRAQASSTAISLAVLWAGVGPHESREVLHTWPLIFDYARAAGYDTAFWTSQNMMFGNSRLWVKNLGVSKFCSATDLDPTADLDMGAPEHLLMDRVLQEIGELSEPFLGVVQLSNVHYPYLLDPTGPQPFQPATTSKAPDQNGSFKNHYQNAVHQQDIQVARVLRHVRASSFGPRTVIVYTSDHGEAFREHHQMGHTFSVYDEEIKVPAFIDAPPGVLTEAEQQNLRAKARAFTFHVDIAPTILDLMRVWDDRGIAPYKEKMLGTSLLRSELSDQPIPLTNCAGVWSCAFENWGYMRGDMKLHAREWEQSYRCFNVLEDPAERHDLGVAACGDLVEHAERTFGRLPGRRKSK